MTRKQKGQVALLIIGLVLVVIVVVIAAQMQAIDNAKPERVKDKIQLAPVEPPRPASSPQMPPVVPKSMHRFEPGLNAKL